MIYAVKKIRKYKRLRNCLDTANNHVLNTLKPWVRVELPLPQKCS